MADNWAEVTAAVEMATETASRAVRAEAVRAENPLFQSMGVEETAMIEKVRCQQFMLRKEWLGAVCTQCSESSVIILGEPPPRDT